MRLKRYLVEYAEIVNGQIDFINMRGLTCHAKNPEEAKSRAREVGKRQYGEEPAILVVYVEVD